MCFRYWPESNIIQHGEFAVSALEQSIHDGYIERVLSVTDSKVMHLKRAFIIDDLLPVYPQSQPILAFHFNDLYQLKPGVDLITWCILSIRSGKDL